jgi:pantetheine-phosphate adenylyltransferase
MKTIALFAGSFNPFHIGHLNILKKSEAIFGKGNVIVCIGLNPDKIYGTSRTSPEEYVANKESEAAVLADKIGSQVIVYTKFLHQLVERYEVLGFNVVVIRGLRNGTDLDYEVNQLRFVSDFKKNVNVVYITCDKEFEHISSSAIRKIQEFGGYEMGSQYLVI